MGCQGNDEDAEERKAHLQWRLEEVYVIRQGSLEALINALSSGSGDIDSTYVNTFLATYRSFATPQDVMKLLLNRWVGARSCSAGRSHSA